MNRQLSSSEVLPRATVPDISSSRDGKTGYSSKEEERMGSVDRVNELGRDLDLIS